MVHATAIKFADSSFSVAGRQADAYTDKSASVVLL